MSNENNGFEICPFCGSELKKQSAFCGRCGQRIPRCPKCGVIIKSSKIKFCNRDGTKIPQETLAIAAKIEKKEKGEPEESKKESSPSDTDSIKKEEIKKKKKRKGSGLLFGWAFVLLAVCIITGLVFVNRDRFFRQDDETEEQFSEADASLKETEESLGHDSSDSIPKENSQESRIEEETSSISSISSIEEEPVTESVESFEESIRENSEDITISTVVETITVAGGYEAPKSDFIFWFSSERPIEIAELYKMTPTGTKDVDIVSMSEADKQIRLNYSQVAIDEIYARHGMTVADSDNPSPADLYAREYLNSLEWYRKANTYYLSGNKTELNDIEKDNISLLYHWQHQYWDEESYVSPYEW